MSFDKPAADSFWSLQQALLEVALLPLSALWTITEEFLTPRAAVSFEALQRLQRQQLTRIAHVLDRQLLRNVHKSLLHVAVFSDPWDVIGATTSIVLPVVELPRQTCLIQTGVIPLTSAAIIRALSKNIETYFAALRNTQQPAEDAVVPPADGTHISVVITFLPALPARSPSLESPRAWLFNADDSLEERLTAVAAFEHNMYSLCPELFERPKILMAPSEKHILEKALGLVDHFETTVTHLNNQSAERPLEDQSEGIKTIRRLFPQPRI